MVFLTPTLDGLCKVWAPQEGPQTAAIECPVEDILFGGAKGGGKTDWLIGDWLKHADLYGKHAHGILFRRTYKQLAEVMRRCQELFPKLGAWWRAKDETWFFPNGAILELRYLDSDADAEQYEGHEFTWEGFDEVGDWASPYGIDRLRSRLRSVHGVPCVSRLTANPKGRGHVWLKRRYITPARPMIPFFDAEKEVYRVFIPSRLQDNQILVKNDPHYVRRLRGSGTPRMVKAWLEGDWSDDLDGGLFDVEKIEDNRLDMTAAQLIKRLGLRPTQYWDLATKEKQLYPKKDSGREPDNSACLTVARDEMDRFILLHGWAGQVSGMKLLQQMHALQARFRAIVKAEKGAIANVVMGVMPLMNAVLGRDFHIIPIGKGAQDKVQHSVPAQMLVNSGNVYLASDCGDWWPAMKEELRAFPHIAADIKDDRVDTLSYAAEDSKRTPKGESPKGHFKLPRDMTGAELEQVIETANQSDGGDDDPDLSPDSWWTE